MPMCRGAGRRGGRARENRAQLLLARLPEGGDGDAERAGCVEDVPDGAVLAGGIGALKDHQQRALALGVEAVLQLVDLLGVAPALSSAPVRSGNADASFGSRRSSLTRLPGLTRNFAAKSFAIRGPVAAVAMASSAAGRPASSASWQSGLDWRRQRCSGNPCASPRCPDLGNAEPRRSAPKRPGPVRAPWRLIRRSRSRRFCRCGCCSLKTSRSA